MDKCPICKIKQWCEMDKEYIKLYDHCWACDRQRWEDGKLTLEEFEKREQQALKFSTN